MKYSVQDIQKRIAEALPEGSVVADHDATGHYYLIDGNRYPSVTGKLQILKDESLINYKKNQVIQYVFRNFSKLTEVNLMEHLELAERVPEDILADASDIGTQIHDTRERIFSEWISSGKKPEERGFQSFIDPVMPDLRLRSAIRALEKFCIDYRYEPIATELFVYSHKLKVAGTLDDVGVMDKVLRAGDANCKHDFMNDRCFKCDRKVKRVFVLMDLKSSNQFKAHYWFQVSLYWEMFRRLTGVKPEMAFILKLSKEDGTYKIEELRNLSKLVTFAKAMLKVNDALDFIKDNRKDNQKNIAQKLTF